MRTTIYLDGASVRLSNRRVSIKEIEKGGFLISFRSADSNPENPACNHTVLKGKVRQTTIKLTEEAIVALLHSYCEYKKSNLTP